MAFIEIKDLHYSYEAEEGETPSETLKGISLSVEKGEFVALLGHNGSGKSTLAKLLSCVLEVKQGQILVDGLDLSALENEEQLFELRRKVGMVFQNPDDQLVATVVEEDIAFGPENIGLPPAEIRRRVDLALRAVGMAGHAKSSPHRLSGGQKQRIAIAGVLAMMPACIVFDEATAMLDPRGRAGVMSMIEKIHGAGVTVLHITHNMDEAMHADRVVVLKNGRVFREGRPLDVLTDTDAMIEAGLEPPALLQLEQELCRLGWPLLLTLQEDEAVDSIVKILGERK